MTVFSTRVDCTINHLNKSAPKEHKKPKTNMLVKKQISSSLSVQPLARSCKADQILTMQMKQNQGYINYIY